MIDVKEEEKTKTTEISVIAQMLRNNHEQVVFCNDPDTGLKAIIAIHNTILGPALGGTRMWSYPTEADALNDVLRLSRGMSYKAAAAGLNLGGGKAVIIGDPVKIKNEAMLRRFGRFINSMGGKYITAEDVAMNSKDMEYIHMETKFVTGIPELLGGSGDPSPLTAYGVMLSMKASAKECWGNESLNGKKIVVQGVGHVGYWLVKYLSLEKADVWISDINKDRVKSVSGEFGCQVAEGDNLYDMDMDIYAPCAMGATVNKNTIPRLKCAIICGSANNQLENELTDGELIRGRGILYAPDFVVNAGGLINVYNELLGYNYERAKKQVENIYDSLTKIFRISREEKLPTYSSANRMAEQRIAAIGKVKLSYC